MRAVIQRVSRAQVRVGSEVTGRIDQGLCVLLAAGKSDSEVDARALADKVVGLRIFEDAAGKMNLDLLEVRGELLVIPQFTLYGDVSRGKRPSFVEAMEPVRAQELFECFCRECAARAVRVETGRFRSQMSVELVNEGPVTILLDTHRSG